MLSRYEWDETVNEDQITSAVERAAEGRLGFLLTYRLPRSERWITWLPGTNSHQRDALCREILRLAEENRRLQNLLDRQERDLVTLREHIGTWKRETLANLRRELLESVDNLAEAAILEDTAQEAVVRVDLLCVDIDRIVPADETPEYGR